MAEQVVIDLDRRLGAWYPRPQLRHFTNECYRNQRNSRANYQRLSDLTESLFERYSRLQVIRVDLNYTEFDTPISTTRRPAIILSSFAMPLTRIPYSRTCWDTPGNWNGNPRRASTTTCFSSSMVTNVRRTLPKRVSSGSCGHNRSPVAKGFTTTAISMPGSAIVTTPWASVD